MQNTFSLNKRELENSMSNSIFLLSNDDIHSVLAILSYIEGNATLLEEEKDLRRRLKEVVNAGR